MIFQKNILKSSFFKNVKWLTSTVILEKAIPFFLLPILTRLLTPVDYGVIATFNAIRGNLDPIISLGTTPAVVRAYYDKKDSDFFSTYFFNAILINIVFSFVFASAVYVFQLFYTFENITTLWLILICFLILFSAVSDIKLELWIHEKKPASFAFFRVLRMALQVGLSLGLILLLLKSWKGRILGIILSEGILFALALFFIIRQNKLIPRINKKHIKDVLKFGLPLIPYSFFLVFLTTADKLFINHFHGTAITGIYGVGYVLGNAVLFIHQPVVKSIMPNMYDLLSNYSKESRKRLIQYFFYMVFFTITLYFAILALAYIALQIFIGPQFSGAFAYVPLIALGYCFFGLRNFLNQFIYFQKKNHLILRIIVFTGLFSLPCFFLLIKHYSAFGAAIAILLNFIFFFFCTLWVVLKLYKNYSPAEGMHEQNSL